MEKLLLSDVYVDATRIPLHLQLENELPSGKGLIDGQLIEGDKSETIYSPLCYLEDNQEQAYRLGCMPAFNADFANRALAAAAKAYSDGMGEWPQMPVYERINHLREFRDRLTRAQADFIRLEMWEIAKPVAECQDEVQRTLKYIDETITNLISLDDQSSSIMKSAGYMAQTRRCPLGVNLIMGPFNYPLNETLAMLVPSLIMGNTAVVKLPRYGSYCYNPLLQAFQGAFPAGVVNIISGEGEVVIPPIIQSGLVTVLGFIGSTAAARSILSQHPCSNRLRSILGLEAKNPAIVLPDCDLDLAVKECAAGALEFNGQRCTALKHIWVHHDIVHDFMEKLKESIAKLKCGLPWQKGVAITPLAEACKSQRLLGWMRDAVNKGAAIQNQGGGNTAGNLFYPTILYPVGQDMDIYWVEQFGPLIPVSVFSDLQEIAEYMRQSRYGQQASIFTSSAANAAPLIDLLVNQVSRINLNAQCRRGPDVFPFTGRKDSAEGTLSIPDALRAFSIRVLTVANDQGKDLFLRTLASQRSGFLRM